MLRLANFCYVRLTLAFLIALVILPFVCDFLWQPFMPANADKLAATLAQTYGNRVSDRATAFACLSQYHLSWVYVTSHGKVLGNSIAPILKEYVEASRNLDYGGQHYYESVRPLPKGEFLHVGTSADGLSDYLLTTNPLSIPGLLSLPLGFVALVLGGLFATILVFINKSINRPIERLVECSDRLLRSGDDEINQLMSHVGGTIEIQRLGASIKQIRSEFDKASYERLTKEHELRKQQQQLEQEKKSIATQYEQHVVSSQRSISELYTKEAEEEFLTSLARELDSTTSVSQACQRTLERLNDKFPTTLTAGAFFISEKQSNYKLDSTVGMSTQAIEVVDDMDHQPIFGEIFSTGRHVALEKERFNDFGLKSLSTMGQLFKAVYLPICFQNRNIGALAFYATEPTQNLNDRLRILRNVAELCSRILYRLLLYREELQSARTDALTGLYNKKFFFEIAPQLFERASVNSEEHPLSLIMIDGDDFKAINDTYGHQIGDQVISELAETVRKCTRMREYGIKPGRPKDYVIRYGGEELLIILENTSAESALHVAERIRKTIENKMDWAGGISKLTASLGVSSYPSDAKNIDELVLKADGALYYVKEHLGKNGVCHSSSVPKGFRATKYATIGGNLGIFDPAALLQSIATAQKSGVLTVEAEDGRKVWMLYEMGRPLQAKVGQFAGPKAIIEFITTFEDGKFSFQEIQPGASTKGSGKNPATRTGTWNVQKGLERCLMDAALAQDNLNWAKTIMPHPNIFPKPVKEEEGAQIMSRLRASGTVTDDEVETMEAMLKLCDDASTFNDVFQRLNHVPTAFLWRAAALLIKEKIVEVSTPDEYASTTLKLKPLATERLKQLQNAETEKQLADDLQNRQKSFSVEFQAMLDDKGGKPSLPKDFLSTSAPAAPANNAPSPPANRTPAPPAPKDPPSSNVTLLGPRPGADKQPAAPDQFAVNKLKALMTDAPKVSSGPISPDFLAKTIDHSMQANDSSAKPAQNSAENEVPVQSSGNTNTGALAAKIGALKTGSAQKAKAIDSDTVQESHDGEALPAKSLASAVGETLDKLLPEPKPAQTPKESKETESEEAKEKRVLEMQLLQMQLAKHNSMTESAMLKKLEPSEKKHPELIDKLEEALNDKLTERKERQT